MGKCENLSSIFLNITARVDEQLKAVIDQMFKFFNQSSIKRNKIFVDLNKKIKFIRSFETTFNSRAKSYNIHFHILLGGDDENEVKEYGNIIIEYWLKYFGDKANRKAQYFKKQEKTILENFKYLFKLKDITGSEIPLLYEFLKAVKHRKLFSTKNIIIEKEEELYQYEKEPKRYLLGADKFHYSKEAANWIDQSTGEMFLTDDMIKNYEKDMAEIKNRWALSEFFNNKKIEIKDLPHPHSLTHNSEDQLDIF